MLVIWWWTRQVWCLLALTGLTSLTTSVGWWGRDSINDSGTVNNTVEMLTSYPPSSLSIFSSRVNPPFKFLFQQNFSRNSDCKPNISGWVWLKTEELSSCHATQSPPHACPWGATSHTDLGLCPWSDMVSYAKSAMQLFFIYANVPAVGTARMNV